MAGNCNSGRRPKYLTIQKFDEFKDKLFNNDLFHLKVELRANTIANGILLALVITLLVVIIGG